MPVGTVNRMQAVAPRTAVITATGAYKNRRLANQRAFALDGGAENLGDAECHDAERGLYSAQVLGVSDTRTAEVCDQRALHHV